MEIHTFNLGKEVQCQYKYDFKKKRRSTKWGDEEEDARRPVVPAPESCVRDMQQTEATEHNS